MSLKLIKNRSWFLPFCAFSHRKIFPKLKCSLVFPSHPIFLWCLTCDVDSIDKGLWDPVPNVHQAGHVDDDTDPPAGLQQAAVVCDVPLNGLHLCPAWGTDRKTCHFWFGLISPEKNRMTHRVYKNSAIATISGKDKKPLSTAEELRDISCLYLSNNFESQGHLWRFVMLILKMVLEILQTGQSPFAG